MNRFVRLENRKHSNSVVSFQFDVKPGPKFHLFRPPEKAPVYFSTGLRPVSVLHARLRYGLSALNAHLFRHHILAEHTCTCGHDWEDATHFFIDCPIYAAQRVVMIDQLKYCLTNICNLSPQQLCALLLFGSSKFTTDVNSLIFASAQNFIISSGCFRIPG